MILADSLIFSHKFCGGEGTVGLTLTRQVAGSRDNQRGEGERKGGRAAVNIQKGRGGGRKGEVEQRSTDIGRGEEGEREAEQRSTYIGRGEGEE